jgi:hypothetical protein
MATWAAGLTAPGGGTPVASGDDEVPGDRDAAVRSEFAAVCRTAEGDRCGEDGEWAAVGGELCTAYPRTSTPLAAKAIGPTLFIKSLNRLTVLEALEMLCCNRDLPVIPYEMGHLG